MPTPSDALKLYKSKRNFSITTEPEEGGIEHPDELTFVIQKHWASRLHYDFRLELDGTMKSWAVPKGPSYDSHDKRMAVHVEDHPISYSSFEGTIPEKQYGAGKVIIWDKGTWHPIGDPHEGYRKGNLKFEMRGHKMHGRWVLVRMKGRGEKQEPWLLIKENDDFTRPAQEYSVVDEMPDSVAHLPMPAEMKGKKTRRAPKAVAPEAEEAPAKTARSAKAATRTATRTAATTASKTASKSPKAKVAAPEGAVKAPLPATFNPELATLVDKPPANPTDWVFEIKFDGYRLLARVEGKDIKLFTRNGNDWTRKMMRLHDALAAAKLPDGWYDGEIVVHNEEGRPDFGKLQMAFDGSNTADIVFFIFDAPYINGYDMRAVPLEQRREVLSDVLASRANRSLRFSAEFGHDPEQIMAAACKMGLEGIIGKKRDSKYVERRSPDWIKLKCQLRQEFVIAGYTDPQGSRTGIGSLVLGVYDKDGQLQYAGNVGTGFNEKTLRDLYKKLSALETADSPLPPKAVPGRKPHWVTPKLVAEVSFAEWTRTGSVRHAVFQGLREDKQAKGIGRELPKHMEEVAGQTEKPSSKDAGVVPQTNLPASLKVTNPERLIDAASGATKIDLIRYYALVGPLMLEHLKSRPLSLVRAPAGVGGELFFQKHADVKKLPGVKQMPVELDPDHPPMLHIESIEGILSTAQWNVVEFHTQNALCRSYEKPNRMVFDLDPGEGVEWKAMQEAAQLVHAFLDQLGLPSFLKTSGGKGLHVVVPVKPQYDWDTVKDFSQAVVQHLARTLPDRFAFKSGPKNRVGKIFIDYLRNGRGATTISAWSARVRPGLGISVPCEWDELMSLKSADQWNIRNAHTRLDKGNDPWKDFTKSAKSITAAMKAMGFK